MSEKRFTTKGIIISNYGVWDTDDKPYANDDVVDLLNEQQATIIDLQEIVIDLNDDKNQLYKLIIKLRQEVAELKTRNAVLSSKLNQIPESIKRKWLEDE